MKLTQIDMHLEVLEIGEKKGNYRPPPASSWLARIPYNGLTS